MSLTGFVTLVTLNRLFLSKSHKGDALALCIGTNIRAMKKPGLVTGRTLLPSLLWSGLAPGSRHPVGSPSSLEKVTFFAIKRHKRHTSSRTKGFRCDTSLIKRHRKRHTPIKRHTPAAPSRTQRIRACTTHATAYTAPVPAYSPVPTANLTVHPLHHKDRPVVDRLLSATQPSRQDIADAARLMNRYEGFLGDPSTWRDLNLAIQRWGLTRGELNDRARVAWQSGWRPDVSDDNTSVGSGADVND